MEVRHGFMFAYEGKHLLIDARATRLDALLDLEIGKDCLTAIAHRIGMTIVMPATGVQFPHSAAKTLPRVQSQNADSARNQANGYSAVVLLAESHISIHTFPEASFLTFDCYSCAPFDESLAVAVLQETYGVADGHVQVIHRQFQPTEAVPSPMVTNAEEMRTDCTSD